MLESIWVVKCRHPECKDTNGLRSMLSLKRPRFPLPTVSERHRITNSRNGLDNSPLLLGSGGGGGESILYPDCLSVELCVHRTKNPFYFQKSFLPSPGPSVIIQCTWLAESVYRYIHRCSPHAFWSYRTKEVAQNRQASNESDKQTKRLWVSFPKSTTSSSDLCTVNLKSISVIEWVIDW